jgi:2-polyprenyl-6-methoxyphenol hydroxylase-like FAD-dependent oxidoreductase
MSSNTRTLTGRAIIIGAGPGGLAAALAVRRAGMEAVVYERAAALRESGAGLTLWPNALTSLEHLGVRRVVSAVCQPLEGIAIRSFRGRTLTVTPRADLERLCGGPGVAVVRAELIDVLLDQVGREAVRLGARCTGYREDGAGVTALFDGGHEVRGDLLIGADGLRSVVAGQLTGGVGTWYAGYTVWRGVTEFAVAEQMGVMSMGPGTQFGCFPLTRRRVYWFASANAPEGSVPRGRSHKEYLLECFGGWHEPVRDILEATDEAEIIITPVHERKPLPRWGERQITLVGDAAHPSAPTLGQGACQALEDAAVISFCLRAGDSGVTSALRDYEARRMARANAMVRQARWMGWLGGWESRPACWLREQITERTPRRYRLRHLQWMCRFPAGQIADFPPSPSERDSPSRQQRGGRVAASGHSTSVGEGLL